MTKLSQSEREFIDLLRKLSPAQREDLKRILEVFKAESLLKVVQDLNR
ncbi:hypothetical protein [Pseudomonas putida]|nr:hypothetical protein [Pseudomonas putida]